MPSTSDQPATAATVSDPSQEVFRSVYRGRQSWLHHQSYMRTGKVFFLLDLIDAEKIPLSGRRIFDYGFGAGTFFHHCPRDSRIGGIEIDAEHVEDTAKLLRGKGYTNVDLGVVDLNGWESHPLLKQPHDVIVCSHVLEHLDEPARLVQVLATSLDHGGYLICLVPTNERAPNPHHVRVVTAGDLEDWGRQAGLEVRQLDQAYRWTYWLQPFLDTDGGWRQKVSQVFYLSLGLFLAIVPRSLHRPLDRSFGAVTGSKPTQMGIVYRKP